MLKGDKGKAGFSAQLVIILIIAVALTFYVLGAPEFFGDGPGEWLDSFREGFNEGYND